MVGLGIAIFAHNQEFAERLHSPTLNFSKPLFFITIALLAFYFAGMVLNDASDAKTDQKHRPERPIPCGAINRRDAWITGIALLFWQIFLSLYLVSRSYPEPIQANFFLAFWFRPVAIQILSIYCKGNRQGALASS